MNFHQILEQGKAEKPEILIPETWGQGRAIFGGLVGSLIYEAIASKIETNRQIRTLNLLFVGPVEVGVAQMETRELRSGKSASLWQGNLLQKGQVQAAVLASFGGDRTSEIKLSAAQAPEWPKPENCPELPYLPGVTPEFTKHFEYRWAEGHMPFRGSDSRKMGGWMRFRSEKSVGNIGYLISLIDAWPPAVLPMLKKPCPASSLNWTLDILRPVTDFTADTWWQYSTEIAEASKGYSFAQATIWNASREAVALSRQTVMTFE